MQVVKFKKQELPQAFTEEIKQIRTNIEYSGSKNKVIMLTSSVASEGKSSLTFQIASSFAELGKRVLIVDADLRKSEVHTKIEGVKPRGLSYFLSGQSELENVLCKVENVPNLYIVTSGRVPPNPAELLSSQTMSNFMEWARKNFDYIFVDCPPITLVTDASILATYADASIFVVKSASISRKLAQDAIKQLEKAGVPIIGVVLNQHSVKRSGYRKYGYGYGYGYGYYEQDKSNS